MSKLTARPGNPLTGIAAIPGDKSCSHRVLILAAMADRRGGGRASARETAMRMAGGAVALVLADHKLLHRGQCGGQ